MMGQEKTQELDDDKIINDNPISKALHQRGIQVIHQKDLNETSDLLVDAMIVVAVTEEKCDTDSLPIKDFIKSTLCPGGTLIISNTMLDLDKDKAIAEELIPTNDPTIVCKILLKSNIHPTSPQVLIARLKKAIHSHKSTCPWLPTTHSVIDEEQRLHEATVPISVQEISSSQLTETSIASAVTKMKQYGYCIIPRLLDQNECHEWGTEVLHAVHAAAEILLQRDNVDIYHPHSSKFEPQSYQELSMREDLRLDIRQGPSFTAIRQLKGDQIMGNQSIVLSSKAKDYCDGIFLRGHPSLLEIVRQTMNPKDDTLYKGNIGRWNFNGTGNDGSYQDLRLSPVGGIVSLPGAADQALHADTPHLFEHLPDLPAHYINIFAPCVPFNEKVGGTAFIHGSHNLAFTAKYCGDSTENDNSQVYPFLVRPKLALGDVVLFDCRILHFGMANLSTDIERVICYTNTWQNWFHDAKNWDKNRAIFENGSCKEHEEVGKK
jgi:hypothetical protein